MNTRSSRRAGALLLGAALFAGCAGGGPSAIRFAGVPVTHDTLSATLAGLEDQFHRLAGEEGWNVLESAGCFAAVRTDGEDDVGSDQAWCGPALSLDSNSSNPWVLFELASYPAFDEQGRELPGALEGYGGHWMATSPLGSGFRFFHPDGKEAPEAGSYTLAMPDPPPVESGYSTVLDGVPGLALTPPKDRYLPVIGGRAEILGVGMVDRYGQGREAVIAAPGEQFLVVRARFEEREIPGEQALVRDPNEAAALEVDGRRFDLDSEWAELLWAGGGERTFVRAIAADANEVSLDVSTYGRAQAYDLLAGQFEGDEVLARGLSSVAVHRQVPVQPAVVGDREATYRIGWNVVDVVLTPYLPSEGWADPGRAWLLSRHENVTFNNEWYSTFPCGSYAFRLTEDGFTVDDGSETHTLAGGGDSHLFVEVPADFTEGTVTMTATYTYDDSCGDRGEATFGSLTYELSF